jgi:hypothetical protein
MDPLRKRFSLCLMRRQLLRRRLYLRLRRHRLRPFRPRVLLQLPSMAQAVQLHQLPSMARVLLQLPLMARAVRRH